MKKIIIYFVAIGVVFSGCNNSPEQKDSNNTKSSEQNKSAVKEQKSPVALAMEQSKYQMPQIISANTASVQTEKTTKELLNKFFANETTKTAFDKLLNFFNTNINRMSNEGYYNSFQLNTFGQDGRFGGAKNSAEFTESVKDLKAAYLKLSEKDRHILKDLVQNELEMKGFVVKRGKEDWDSEIHMIVGW
jgi:PBP1b-binding outer membrane lipoprotein LpoB